ncbi:MerR family transcriptional regulator [Burkholderia metallica]|uniref:MerR family transcriptional regulator n=1 Tax=Burkholderia metallica TaxID=488729 RepID=UPI00157B0311|nr:MerR family transcriptional regulator [Burkholderia metallica]NTZ88992.1 MerR family transcriptional regulator [Burkholderia metallica]
MTMLLTLSSLAERAGVHVETIRYYQRRGLLPVPEKPLDSPRRYRQETVTRVRFIKKTQALGFTLEEIRELLRLDEDSMCSETKARMQSQLVMIERKIANLIAMRDALGRLTGLACISASGGCPLIAALGIAD